MPALPPNISSIYLSALKEGLVEFLLQQTGIDWQYYKSSIVPSLGAKGGLKISKITPNSQNLNLDTHLQNYLYVQGRVIVASDESEDKCEKIILAWQQFLEDLFKSLSIVGLNGTWDSTQVRNGLMGIQLSERGYQLAIEETSVDQNTDECLWTGLLFFEYISEYERYIQGSLQ